MKNGRFSKITLFVLMLFVCTVFAGCGGKKSSKDSSSDAVVTAVPTEETTEAPTEAPTETPAETPTPTPYPEIKAPGYKLIHIDSAKNYDRYYSTYYFEFDEPGYYFKNILSKAKYFDSVSGNKTLTPVKIASGEIPEEGDKTRYFAVIIFMSKEDDLLSDSLSIEAGVIYRFDNKNTVNVETEPFVVNTKKEDFSFDRPDVKNYPFIVEGHYMIQDTHINGVAYGSPENDKTKDYIATEYNFIRLSFGDMDYKALEQKFDIVSSHTIAGQVLAYVPPKGFEKYIGLNQTTDDGLRYFRVFMGLAYDKNTDKRLVAGVQNEIKKNMELVIKK